MSLAKEIRATLGEEIISEEVAEKFAELLTTKLDERASEVTAEKDAEIVTLKENANAYGEQIFEQATSKVTEYVDAAMKEFIKENTENFQKLEETARAVSALAAIKTAFEDVGMILEQKDPDAEVAAKLESANATVETLLSEQKDLSGQVDKLKMEIAFRDHTSNLTLTQVDKVRTLSESVTFNGVDEFSTALGIIVETVINESKTPEATKPAPDKPAIVKNRWAAAADKQ